MADKVPCLLEIPSVLDESGRFFDDEEDASIYRQTSGRIFLTLTSSGGYDAGQIDFERLLREAARVPELRAIMQRVLGAS